VASKKRTKAKQRKTAPKKASRKPQVRRSHPKPAQRAKPAKKKTEKPMAAKKGKAPTPAQIRAREEFARKARAGTLGGGGKKKRTGTVTADAIASGIVRGAQRALSPPEPDHHLIEQRGPVYRMELQTIVRQELNPVAVGQLWVGFVGEMRDPCDNEPQSIQRQFPKSLAKHLGECWQGCGCEGVFMNNAEWEKYENQRGVGMSMAQARLAGNAFVFLNVTEQEWVAFYRRAKNVAAQCAPTGMGPANVYSQGGWISPLGAPSWVTQGGQFGAPRDGGSRVHQGVDLHAPKGTPVVAPYNMKITQIGRDDKSGLFVQAVMQRPDGRYPELGALQGVGDDDSGWISEFLHLDAVLPDLVVGKDVAQGEVFATSGDSGSPGQPHLHWRLEWYEDGTVLNSRVFVDPLALVPTQALAAPGVVAPVASGVAAGITAPKGLANLDAGIAASSSGSLPIVINNNGVIGIGRDNVRASKDQQFNLDLGLAPFGATDVKPFDYSRP